MSGAERGRYDVAIVGAGPVGSLCALAHARNGYSVVVLEANPNTSKRLAGEWLHPPAVRVLRALGIEPDAGAGCIPGKGFVVFPEDGGEPIVLPYPDGRPGVVWEHERLVLRLRRAVEDEPSVDVMMNARVRSIEGDLVSYSRNGEEGSVAARLIVGADGRASVVRRSLGLSTKPQTYSQMLGVLLNDVTLPFEEYGHVICAERGPILIYRLGERSARLIVDVPAGYSTRDMIDTLAGSYAASLPGTLGPAFLQALREGRFLAATNALRPRHTYGTPGRVLIGDAAGHYHPLTAAGMTLGFGDAFTLAEGGDYRDFANRRLRETRASELLAMGLYEVFADRAVEAAALRHTIYRQWREKPAIRDRTIRLLACEDTSVVSLSRAVGTTAARALATETRKCYKPSAWRRTRPVMRAIAVRFLSLGRGMLQLRKAGGVTAKEERARATLSKAFPTSMRGTDPRPGHIEESTPPNASAALRGAAAHLLSLQRDDGGAAPWRRRDSSPVGIRVHPAATTIGATVEGIDLTEPITDPSSRRIREALDAYGVLVFPDQHAVDDEAQLLLAELWGSPSPAPWETHHGRSSLITRVYTNDSFAMPSGRDCAFHTDMSFTEQIPAVGVLRPIVIPPSGGATTWADARAALGSLDPSLVDELRGLSAHHDGGDRFAQKMALIFGAEAGDTVTSRFADGCQHPVVAAHPRTGDEVLFVNPRYTRYVVDMPDADSDDLLGRLFAAFERPELQFTHQWRAGDVAVWDEHRVVHRAPADYGSYARELHRCTAGWHRPGPAST